jgi:hypothetical protein
VARSDCGAFRKLCVLPLSEPSRDPKLPGGRSLALRAEILLIVKLRGTVSTHTEPHEIFYAEDISCLEALSVCQNHTECLKMELLA